MLIGIVGKPNCGKSTFFKAATQADIEIGNYPFVTIQPNHGMGYVKIKDIANDFDKTANPREGYVQGNFRFVPIEILDVAGIVPGAHEGKGMGNQFLDDFNQADALIHVIDVSGSTNEKGEAVNALSYNPSEDIRFLEFELDMWYLRIIKKGWEKFARSLTNKEIHKEITKQLSGLKVTENMVKDSIKDLDENPKKWNDSDLNKLATQLREMSKPIIIAANKIDVPGAKENFERLKKEFPNYTIISCSAESELALKEAEKHDMIDYIPGEKHFEIKGDLTDKQTNALEFIKKNVLVDSTGLQKILNEITLNILDYIAIHPGGANKLEDSKGNVLPDCFLLKNGSTALDFAYRLHTDFGKNFIKAIDVKTKKIIGKEHKLKHLDIIELYV
ncbi:redox-regulated ATPase YchF [archaeon]|nr:redox-regulated ATPase YchF [archaeon]